LNGPNAAIVAVPRNPENFYNKELSTAGLPVPGAPPSTPVIAPGTYTLSATGGNDVGPFTASVTVPAPLDWTNRAAVTSVNRGQDLRLTWTGGGNSTVQIIGASANRISGGATDGIYDAAIFQCEANAAAGSFTVPSSILSQLPASGGDINGSNVGLLAINSAGNGQTGRFTAPLRAGGNADFALFNYSVAIAKILGYL
jgi:hypothetical protein